jgi:hypothetical protein
VLRVDSVFKKGVFTLQLQMWDGRTGKTLSSDGKTCDICTLPDLHIALRDRVAALCARVFEAEDAALAPPPVPVRVTPATPPPALDVSPPAPTSSAGQRVAQASSLVLMAVGVATAAYGGYLLHLNGQSACGPDQTTSCDYHHVTRVRGIGLLAGGLGAVILGGVLFYSFTW